MANEQTKTEESKHTPGIWYMNCTNKFIDLLPGMLAITDEKDRLIAGVSHDLTQLHVDEYASNAELIAKAPKLLEENKELKEMKNTLIDTVKEDGNMIAKLALLNKELKEQRDELLKKIDALELQLTQAHGHIRNMTNQLTKQD